MKYFLSAGEASGDLHGAALVEELRRQDPGASFVFLGGDLMARAAGGEPLIHYRRMAFMAFAEVLRHLGDIRANMRRARRALEEERPDRLVLIDYPGFNMPLARHGCRLGIPVYYYIAPKVWAWKSWRVRSLRRHCRRILSILPFEPRWFAARGMARVTYVGNPSVEEIEARQATLPSLEEFLRSHDLPGERPLLALVPGSRRGEVRNNLPVMVEAARLFPQLQPVVACAPGIDTALYEQYAPGVPRVEADTFALMAHSQGALVTSGTATLEAALLRTPQAVCYRATGSRLSYWLMKPLIKCPFVALPNLIAGRGIVDELLLHRCTPEAAAASLRRVLPGEPGHQAQQEGYADMRRRLGPAGAAARAAAIVCAR